MKKCVIVEIIPTKRTNGNIAQISALKLEGIKLIDRFDYRLKEEKIDNEFILEMINYDKEKFNYLESTNEIISKFKNFCTDSTLYIIDNDYTNHYLNDLENDKKSVFDILGIENNNNAITEMIKKYNLEPSNYIVDLIYEAFIYENN